MCLAGVWLSSLSSIRPCGCEQSSFLQLFEVLICLHSTQRGAIWIWLTDLIPLKYRPEDFREDLLHTGMSDRSLRMCVWPLPLKCCLQGVWQIRIIESSANLNPLAEKRKMRETRGVLSETMVVFEGSRRQTCWNVANKHQDKQKTVEGI